MPDIEVKECGCEWESLPDEDPLPEGTVPGSRKIRRKQCDKHQRESRVRNDGQDNAESIIEEALNDYSKREEFKMFIEAVIEHLECADLDEVFEEEM